jgi:hypothetical protein
MKKVLFVAVMMLVSVGVASVTPVLVEAYQEGTISIPRNEWDTITVAEVSFSVDSACYVMLATGGMADMAKVWLELDGESLPPVIRVGTGDEGPINITYTYLLEAGGHTISVQLANHLNFLVSTTCRDGYLQALIFLPDTATGAVAEQPMGDAEPLPNTPSLISSGPYVNVAGATELVDASGRVIENAIEDDKVFISNLPQGTYFARDGERTIVKIVKVE